MISGEFPRTGIQFSGSREPYTAGVSGGGCGWASAGDGCNALPCPRWVVHTAETYAGCTGSTGTAVDQRRSEGQ